MTKPTTNPALRRLWAFAALLVLGVGACGSDSEASTAADAVDEPVSAADEKPELSTSNNETAPQDDDLEQQQEDEPEQEAEAEPSTPENEAAAQADEPEEAAEPESSTPEDTEAAADEPQEQTVSDAAAAIDDPEAAAAAEAFALVYDSNAAWADKAPHLENAAALEASNAAYEAAGEQMGGVALAPTAAEVSGDTATITYNVLFGGNPAYEDLTRPIMLVEGVWVVSEAEYCSFLASARSPCS